MTPTGVEHNHLLSNQRGEQMAIPSMTPTGVEHKLLVLSIVTEPTERFLR